MNSKPRKRPCKVALRCPTKDKNGHRCNRHEGHKTDHSAFGKGWS
jgi:hypothetical protein